MFGDLTSGNAFYSEPEPNAIGPQPVKETGDLDRARELPLHASPPPYARYQDAGADSFAPSGTPIEKSFRPEIPNDPAVVGPPMLSLPLIAAGIFTLWLIFKESK